MVLHAIPESTEVRSIHRRLILAPRGNDVTNHVNTGIYVRRPKSFLNLERGEVRQVQASI
jgi:hypothetical protein